MKKKIFKIFSFILMTQEKVSLYVMDGTVADGLPERLSFVEIKAYEDIYKDIAALPEGSTLWLDPATCNCALYGSVPAGVSIREELTPAALMKMIKNEAEIKGMRRAHVLDGIAVIGQCAGDIFPHGKIIFFSVDLTNHGGTVGNAFELLIIKDLVPLIGGNGAVVARAGELNDGIHGIPRLALRQGEVVTAFGFGDGDSGGGAVKVHNNGTLIKDGAVCGSGQAQGIALRSVEHVEIDVFTVS
jgi:hypothetical protein